MSHTDISSIRRALFQKRTNNIIVILFRFSVLGDAARLLMLKKSKHSKKVSEISTLNGQKILVCIKKQQNWLKILSLNNITLPNNSIFYVSYNSGNLLGTKNAWGALVKVSQLCSCSTLIQHVGYHSSWFFISFSKDTLFF